MRWDSRQRAMLLEMGIRLWPSAAEGLGGVEGVTTTALGTGLGTALGTDIAAGLAADIETDIATEAETATPTALLTGTAATTAISATNTRAAPTTTVDAATAAAMDAASSTDTGRAAAPVVQPRIQLLDDQPRRAAPAPAAGDSSSLDWPELEATVAACTACALCQGRRQTVFGTGNRQAHWMIVGEAPGEAEDRLGEPFVGKSGQLLDNMLRAVGLARTEDIPERQVYIANTIKCRPPGNRNPTPDELASCEPFLMRQVQLVQPRIILAMGRFAVDCLLRSNEPIGRLRGRLHQYQGVPLVVTYHPAYLLRNPQDKARAWDDLCLAADTVQAAPTMSPVSPTPVSSTPS